MTSSGEELDRNSIPEADCGRELGSDPGLCGESGLCLAVGEWDRAGEDGRCGELGRVSCSDGGDCGSSGIVSGRAACFVSTANSAD